MGRVTHYVLINTEDKHTAQQKVENRLFDFGNENNWFDIKNVIDIFDENNREVLNPILEQLNEEISQEKFNMISKTIEDISKTSNKNSYAYYQLSQLYKTLSELSHNDLTQQITAENLINLNDYYGWCFDDFGFTSMISDDVDNNNIDNIKESQNIYLVEISMHV